MPTDRSESSVLASRSQVPTGPRTQRTMKTQWARVIPGVPLAPTRLGRDPRCRGQNTVGVQQLQLVRATRPGEETVFGRSSPSSLRSRVPKSPQTQKTIETQPALRFVPHSTCEIVQGPRRAATDFTPASRPRWAVTNAHRFPLQAEGNAAKVAMKRQRTCMMAGLGDYPVGAVLRAEDSPARRGSTRRYWGSSPPLPVVRPVKACSQPATGPG